ncbi:MAG: PIG-L family deacetylase [Bryobacteraceae bacterium]|nr:PIG-L family deacetylase [Bryobacterales bacterium]MEB2360217.1 PIG-L family deacetylase [Bryobacterales bacterium]NUM99873.1 PIG-L family deacetylase [Bryobacteraceae bacterium]
MENVYSDYVDAIFAVQKMGERLPLGGFDPLTAPPAISSDKKVMGFAPHPDDMEIGGVLPVRLRRLGMPVLSVAVTLGSNKARRPGRLAELKGASKFLGYELVEVQEGGFERINPAGRSSDPENWKRSVQRIAALISEHRPAVIVVPHPEDFNSTHIGTNLLVMEALTSIGPSFTCQVALTEFWFPLRNPNVMLEVEAPLVADLVGAVSYHVGEVERNPYHLTLVPYMIDNVRRAELVLGIGAAAPPWKMAILMRVEHWNGTRLEPSFEGGRLITASDTKSLKELLSL